MSVSSAEAIPVAEAPHAETRVKASRLESPYVVFPALILLLIMPLGIVFHPTWLPTVAEIGAAVMFAAIFRMMRM